ncbi:unnamed protein product [Microthlaspi erraticum]|uniref:FKB95-like N-terminal Kelch domain-containing protein n=1 Tax=Microthlaspi erraticum TaxID=1685480 RepID=A0A6D2J8Q6_9BRAS|nr:unnamed protein product [Microthlaspi erraticum]
MPSHIKYVPVGSKIYVFGNHHYMTLSALSIDCRSNTVQHLPSMTTNLIVTVGEFIDGKIYIIGYCNNEWKKVKMVVFNTETQIWEPEIIKQDIAIDLTGPIYGVVIADKMYVRGRDNTFVYEPKGGKWKKHEMLSSKRWENACVVDGVLYYYDRVENMLRTYDPKHMCWGVVNGLERFFAETRDSLWLETVGYGGKLVLFFHIYLGKIITNQIWCAEILLERRQGGDNIWGKPKGCNHVTNGRNFHLRQSLAVML